MVFCHLVQLKKNRFIVFGSVLLCLMNRILRKNTLQIPYLIRTTILYKKQPPDEWGQ